jgi:hypothetical protein
MAMSYRFPRMSVFRSHRKLCAIADSASSRGAREDKAAISAASCSDANLVHITSCT